MGPSSAAGAAGGRPCRSGPQAPRGRPRCLGAARRVRGGAGPAAGLVADDGSLEPVWAPTPVYDEWQQLPGASRWAVLARAWLASTRSAAPRGRHVPGRLGHRQRPRPRGPRPPARGACAGTSSTVLAAAPARAWLPSGHGGGGPRCGWRRAAARCRPPRRGGRGGARRRPSGSASPVAARSPERAVPPGGQRPGRHLAAAMHPHLPDARRARAAAGRPHRHRTRPARAARWPVHAAGRRRGVPRRRHRLPVHHRLRAALPRRGLVRRPGAERPDGREPHPGPPAARLPRARRRPAPRPGARRLGRRLPALRRRGHAGRHARRPRAGALQLRRIAPTVLVSPVAAPTALEFLRDDGYAPAAESADGGLLGARHRPAPRLPAPGGRGAHRAHRRRRRGPGPRCRTPRRRGVRGIPAGAARRPPRPRPAEHRPDHDARGAARRRRRPARGSGSATPTPPGASNACCSTPTGVEGGRVHGTADGAQRTLSIHRVTGASAS